MSRIGIRPITVPAGVEVTVDGNLVTVKGPKGQLSQEISKNMTVEVEEGTVKVTSAPMTTDMSAASTASQGH